MNVFKQWFVQTVLNVKRFADNTLQKFLKRSARSDYSNFRGSRH